MVKVEVDEKDGMLAKVKAKDIGVWRGRYEVVIPQCRPLSPGEILGCTAPKLGDVDGLMCVTSPRTHSLCARRIRFSSSYSVFLGDPVLLALPRLPLTYLSINRLIPFSSPCAFSPLHPVLFVLPIAVTACIKDTIFVTLRKRC